MKQTDNNNNNRDSK